MDLEALGGNMKDIDTDVIRAMADCNMRQYAVSKKIYAARSTVNYRIRKIKQETGLDPRKFCDLVKLLDIIGEK